MEARPAISMWRLPSSRTRSSSAKGWISSVMFQFSLSQPAGTQQDKTLRIKGLGIPSLKSHSPGDQLFVVKIQIPTKLTPRQKELLKEFAKESGMSMEEDSDGFFDKMKTFFE
jgi:DnaJ-class molecular chaperone